MSLTHPPKPPHFLPFSIDHGVPQAGAHTVYSYSFLIYLTGFQCVFFPPIIEVAAVVLAELGPADVNINCAHHQADFMLQHFVSFWVNVD